ncbi:hypothetical protein CA160_02805 [Vibrio parahaemolyticus]|nr:hypothetical protein [Vibrio parahaemolyticus]EGR2705810.1 hypothetical protein [Vibrio parahaemolyticus]ODZ20080.1 hypothetical protein BBM36_16680 [Vibrio parahaemolyticus]OEA54212.1 hypothetical protein BBM65_15625 [Vibrio parahaemolyticus]OXD05135.1 hypothetical protein CA161_01735 [Vibrio parahaemolyticus]
MLKMLGFSHFSLFFGYRFQWFAWLYGLGFLCRISRRYVFVSLFYLCKNSGLESYSYQYDSQNAKNISKKRKSDEIE